MAHESFKMSCEYPQQMIDKLSKQKDVDEEKQQESSIGSYKFKLAIRQAQKGLANFYILRSYYTNRAMLDGIETNALEGRLPTNPLSPKSSFDDSLKARVSRG